MPTNPVNAGIMLKQAKARVIHRTPFTTQLLHDTTEHIQTMTVGINDGGINVGVAAVSNCSSKICRAGKWDIHVGFFRYLKQLHGEKKLGSYLIMPVLKTGQS